MPPQIVFEPEYLRLPLPLQVFLAVWLFWFGGCVGSFMNVVVFRWPRGRSLSVPPSQCPGCAARIRWHDNLPVVGWLWLRGRCRACGMAISGRYPLVEGIVGLFFVLLGAQAFVPGGPWWLAHVAPRELLWEPWWKLLAALVVYAWLACTLFCAALMAWDGARAPRRLFVAACLLCGGLPFVWPELRPWGESSPADWHWLAHTFFVGIGGAGLGWLIGDGFDRTAQLREAEEGPLWRCAPALVTCGWLLGHYFALIAACGMGPLALAWFALAGRSRRAARSAPLMGLTLSVALLVLAGRGVTERISPQHSLEMMLAAVVSIAASGALLRWWSPPPEAVESASFSPEPDAIYP